MSDKLKINISIDKRKALRNIILIVAIILVLGMAYLLHEHEPNLAYSELIKVVTGAFVLIGIIYSIMTYELAQKKNHQDMHMQKISATYKAASEWFSPYMLDCSKCVTQFQASPDYNLVHTDVKGFADFIDDPQNSELKKSFLCLFNYCESISVATNENMMDEDFVKKYFKGVFIRYYNDYLPYIHHKRIVKQNPEVWVGFTSLVEKWKTSK